MSKQLSAKNEGITLQGDVPDHKITTSFVQLAEGRIPSARGAASGPLGTFTGPDQVHYPEYLA